MKASRALVRMTGLWLVYVVEQGHFLIHVISYCAENVTDMIYKAVSVQEYFIDTVQMLKRNTLSIVPSLATCLK